MPARSRRSRGVTVLRQAVGTARLQTDGGDGKILLCHVVVKKNRITTVTLSPLERPPRCQCERTSGADGAPAGPVSVSVIRGKWIRLAAGSCPRVSHFIVGMTNSAPSLVPEGQRAVTVLVLV